MKENINHSDFLNDSVVLYKNIIENIMDLVIVLDLNGKFIYVSPQISDISGFKPEEVIGKSGFEFMHPDDLQKAAVALQEGIEQNKKVYIEYRTIHKKGYYIDVAANGKIVDIGGKKRIFAIVRNISEQKNAAQKLRESEEKFRNIADQSFMGIIVIQNGLFRYYNEKASEINGYSIEEINNWKPNEFSKVIHPEDRDFVMEQANKKQAGDHKVVNNYQTRIIRKDGETRWLDIYSKSINYEGSIADLVMNVDITDKIEAERRLRESEEKFRTIAEHSFIGILIIQDDKVEYVNKALLDIFEYSANEVENWSKLDLTKLIDKGDIEYLRDYRNQLRQGNLDLKPYYSYQVYTKSGKKKWIDQFSKEIKYKGNPAELVTIMDITEKKVAEQELVKLNSLKSELMRRTSHELKTPLVSIKGYADLLLTVHKETLDDYILSSVVEIKQGCERLENLIQDILHTAELESGTTQLKKIEDDLAFFIKLCIRELRGLARLRNQTVISKINNKLITCFEPEQIHQVISNLINNAIKYTPPDGVIEINSELIDGFIKISVKDSGIGITEEEKERLFSQFGKIERYGQGLDIISEGSGLGLYISKKVIELHGGKLWVESQGRNKGSTFFFTLPIIQ
jgi:PAS domain S-box-containing protein